MRTIIHVENNKVFPDGIRANDILLLFKNHHIAWKWQNMPVFFDEEDAVSIYISIFEMYLALAGVADVEDCQ